MKKRVQAWWRSWFELDFVAVAAAAGLLATGLAFIYSASWRGEETGIVGAWFSRQIWWVAIGAAAAIPFATRYEEALALWNGST